MARRARSRSNSQICHILLRGTEKQDIFVDDEDKKEIMQILKDKKQGRAFFLYAYYVVNNHIHLVIREGINDISRIFKRTATCYSSYFNKKYSRPGHVFQDRFKSETVNGERCLQAVAGFIRQNPEKAGIADIRACPAITVPSIPADFPFGFVVVGLDTQSICASIRLAEQKIITESDGTFITGQALNKYLWSSWRDAWQNTGLVKDIP